MAFWTASVIPYGFSLLLSFVTGTPGFAAPRPAPAAPPCGAPPRLPCDNNSPSSVPNKLTAAASPPIKPRRVTFFGSILGFPPYHPRIFGLLAAFYASEAPHRERFLFSDCDQWRLHKSAIYTDRNLKIYFSESHLSCKTVSGLVNVFPPTLKVTI